MPTQLSAPPQDTRVRLTHSTKEEAGRFAVAQCTLSPGELVLAAAPYGLVLNPKFCPSALYLSSRCSASSCSSSSVAGANSAGGEAERAKRNEKGGKNTAKGGKAAKKGGSKHGAISDGAASSSAADAAAQLTAPYKDALYGAGSQISKNGTDAVSGGAGPVSATDAPRWYTTQPTWCAVCFQEIPAGRWLCNRGSLAELAVDISWEQEELDTKLRFAAAAAAALKEKEEKTLNISADGEDDAGVKYEDVRDSDDGEDGAGKEAAHTAAALRKLKKPTKSAKTRKDGAIELKQKLLDKALAQREEIFYERRLQKRSRAEHGCPAVRREGWEALPSANGGNNAGEDGPARTNAAAAAFDGAMAGCSGCGVLCYCSEVCWRVHHTQHVESGECAVLRGLYPRLMSEYYATANSGSNSSSNSAAGGSAASQGTYGVIGGSSVVLPGDEPLHWARSSSEQKMLEFQSLLFSAVVLGRAAREGYASHFTRDTAGDGAKGVQGSVDTEDEKAAAGEASDGIPAQGEVVDAAGGSELRITPTATIGGAAAAPASITATAAAVDSVVVPKEVHTIHEIRTKAGLTGTVEVLDNDAALRDEAARVDDKTVSVTCVDAAGLSTLFAEESTTLVQGKAEKEQLLTKSDAQAAAAATSSTGSLSLSVHLPRYADMAQMETNLSVISKPRRSTYLRYYRAFLKRVLPTLQLLDLIPDEADEAEQSNSQPQQTDAQISAAPRLCVSESYFLRLCAAAQCNSFGVYDTDDNCIAFGMYPEASYFNHSCVPNICRVMHHGGRLAAFYALRTIEPNEPLTISYTDVEQMNSAERRRNLLETYRFFCMCERCSGHAEGPVMAVGRLSNPATAVGDTKHTRSVLAVPPSLFEKPLLLCAQCAIRGYLRPLSTRAPGEAAWGMGDVQARECTVCHCRVVRDTT